MDADEFQRLFNVRYSGHPTLSCAIPKPPIRSGSKPLEQFEGCSLEGPMMGELPSQSVNLEPPSGVAESETEP